MSVEKKIYPESGKLQIKDGVASATIVDAEMDSFKCTFGYDKCVTIKTNGADYIVLDFKALEELKELITKAEEYCDGLSDEEFEKVFG